MCVFSSLLLLCGFIVLADSAAQDNADGWNAVEAGEFEKALQLFGRAADTDPSNGEYRRYVGWVLYAKLARFNEALPHLRQAVRLMPGSIEARLLFSSQKTKC